MSDFHVKIAEKLEETNTKQYNYVKGMRRNLNVNEIASLGSNVKPVIQNENCSVLMLNDATGEGVMTVYRVMPGVMICFSDMHMEQCASEFYLYSFVAYLYELESGADCSDGCCCFSDSG